VKSLAARLVVTYVALIVATTALAGVGIVGLTRRYFVDSERQSMLIQARVVAAGCDDACLAAGAPFASVDARALPPASNISRDQSNSPSNLAVDQAGVPLQQNVQAVLPSNITIIATDADRASLSRLVTEALSGKESTSVTGSQVQAAVPIRRSGNVVGAVQTSGTLSNVEAVLADVRRQVLLALIGSAVVATLIGIWRARSIAKPVKELTRAAHQLSVGNFDASLPSPGTSDELGELTRAFDVLRNAVRSELRARSAFVGDASHELRTPLTAMRGAVEILRSEAGNRPEVRDRFLGSLQTEMDRLLQLVESLLTLNAADHAGANSASEAVDLVELTANVVADLQPLASQRGITLVLASPATTTITTPTARVVSGMSAALRQLLINVIDNAMIHAPTGKTVDIGVRSDGADSQMISQITIDVRDRGPGIPHPERDRVFERFTRLDSARTRAHGATTGAGLGLAIARTVAQQHGGNIEFVDPSDSEGGVIARITLPALDSGEALRASDVVRS
jgi:signal transduction histidine kinase